MREWEGEWPPRFYRKSGDKRSTRPSLSIISSARKRAKSQHEEPKRYAAFTRSQRPRRKDLYYKPRRLSRKRRFSGKSSPDEWSPPPSHTSRDDKSLESHVDPEHFRWEPNMKLMLRPDLEVKGELGEGTFGKVFCCLDHTRKEVVAVKIIGAAYRSAGEFEAEILEIIAERDAEGQSGCVKCYSWFLYKEKYVCIVTEKLGMSLYSFLERNRFRPFHLDDIKIMCKDLIKSLAFLRAIRLTHTDLKPENILLIRNDIYVPSYGNYQDSTVLSETNVSHDGTWRRFVRPRYPNVKIADFGGGTFHEDDHCPLINTRQYRAPEVILETGWNEASDLWSIGCVLFELYTGRILFKTHDHLEHLHLIERIIGPIPHSMLKRAYDQGSEYVTRDYTLKNLDRYWRHDDFMSLEALMGDGDRNFRHFVRSILGIDPDDRPTPTELLRHPFLNEETLGKAIGAKEGHGRHYSPRKWEWSPNHRTQDNYSRRRTEHQHKITWHRGDRYRRQSDSMAYKSRSAERDAHRRSSGSIQSNREI